MVCNVVSFFVLIYYISWFLWMSCIRYFKTLSATIYYYSNWSKSQFISLEFLSISHFFTFINVTDTWACDERGMEAMPWGDFTKPCLRLYWLEHPRTTPTETNAQVIFDGWVFCLLKQVSWLPFVFNVIFVVN